MMLAWLFCVLTTLSHSVFGHFGCSTDKQTHHIVQNMNINPYPHSHSIMQGRSQNPRNLSVAYSNIRIKWDTSQLESDWSSSYAETLSYFKNDVIPAAYEWLQKVISVRPVDGALTFDVCNQKTGTVWPQGTANEFKCKTPLSTWQRCGDTGAIIDRDMFDEEEICSTYDGPCTSTQYPQGSGITNTDLVVYFTSSAAKEESDNCDNVMGFAGPCHSNAIGRPIAGYINLCKVTIEQQGVFTWEEAVALIIHETFHVLGFVDAAFNGQFVYSDGTKRTDIIRKINKRGKLRAVVTLPTVVAFAKMFFSCDSMDGIELEDYKQINGAASSHWDNRIIAHDFMTSYVPQSPSFSIFTLAVLQDSGWYAIDWKYGQEPPQGRGNGCDWYDDECINSKGKSIDDSVFCDTPKNYSCGASAIGNHKCKFINYNTNLPSNYRYFTDDYTGGQKAFADYCPLLEQTSHDDCRLYGHNNEKAGEEYAELVYGGFISGASKCIKISGYHPIASACFPTQCFINSIGEYVGTRITYYRNYKWTLFNVLTCFSDESSDIAKDFHYVYEDVRDYGFTQIYCPKFTDICYNKNPWICDGHGTIVDDICVCSPGYFGIDCSIEATAANKIKYTAADSVSLYKLNVCHGTDAFDYDESDENVGILSVTIHGIVDANYVEKYFKIAIQNFVAILTDINQCEIDLRDYNYANNAVNVDVFYYSTLKTWNQIQNAYANQVFYKLFHASNTIEIKQEKESKGSHPDNVNSSVSMNINMFTNIVFIIAISVAYLL